MLEDPDPDTVGFAFPLPPLEFSLRNSRKFPPPSEEAVGDVLLAFYELIPSIYDHICLYM